MKRITAAARIVLKRARRSTFKNHIPLEDPNETNNQRWHRRRINTILEKDTHKK
jgi:hypothetical protein